MMCGDGTNDVGSLKAATVGIALTNKAKRKETAEEKKANKRLASPFYWPSPAEREGLTMEQLREKQKKHAEAYMKKNSMRMDLDGTMIELGDACIAAPFTYKFSSIKAVQLVLRQGRTTLTTTFQMYKILALNSLISAYAMSALYLDGVKTGDYQATYLGICLAIMFMMISLSKPLKRLQPLRPPSSIFHVTLVVSVLI